MNWTKKCVWGGVNLDIDFAAENPIWELSILVFLAEEGRSDSSWSYLVIDNS